MNKFELVAFVTAVTLAWSHPAYAIPAAAAFLAAYPLLTAVLVIGGLYMMGKMQAKKQQQQRSLLVNKQSNNDPIPVVYGQKRIGGVRAYINTSNGAGDTAGTEYLNVALTMCEGKTGALKKLIFNDKIIWDADDSSTAGTLTAISSDGDVNGFTLGNFLTTTPNFGSKVSAVYHNGSSTQVVDAMLSTSIGSDWSTNNRLRGIAYMALKIQFDAEIFEGGVPTVTAEFLGKQIQDVSAISQGDSSRTLAAGSADQNPVDVLYDMLVAPIYGKELDHNGSTYSAGQDIDLTSFQSARSYAASRYKINGHLDTDTKLYENINEVMDSFNAMLIYTNGKYRLKIRQSNETAVSGFVFDESNIVGDINVTLQDIKKRLNTMQSTYANKALTPPTGDGYEAYNDDTLVVPETTDSGRVAYLAADNDRILESRIQNNLISDSATLKTLLNHKLDDSRHGTMISFDAGHTAVQVEAGDIVAVTHPMLGFDNKAFRVLQLGITPEGTINIVAVEYIASIEI